MIFYIYINKIINNSPSISCLQKYKLKIPQHTSFVSCVLDEAFPVSHTSFFCFRFCFLCQFKFLLSRENLHAAFSRDFSFPVPANRFRDRNHRFNLCSIPSPFRFPVSSQKGFKTSFCGSRALQDSKHVTITGYITNLLKRREELRDFWQRRHHSIMIVKRTMKTEASNLKRCEIEDSENAIRKKRRVTGFYSLGVPGDAEYFSSGSGSLSSEGSYWGGGGEVQSNSNSVPFNRKMAKESRLPPLLRSSRGHAQKIPSRCNGSVLDAADGDSSFEDNGKSFVEDGNGGISVKVEKSESVCYSSSVGKRTVVKAESNTSGISFEGVDQKPIGEKRREVYKPEDFALGDIVWAKCGKRYPAWPAVVIDPVLEAPESVLSCCVPGALCVMFFGYSKNGTQRDYAWVKQGMVFPFSEFMDRFQGQTRLYKSKPSDFRMALEEAMLAEDGVLESHLGRREEVTHADAHPDGLMEATGSYVDEECYGQDQDTRYCAGCGLMFPCKTMKKIKDSNCAPRFYCKHCSKLRKSKQYCGICKRIWHHSDGGNWVCCDGCNVWVHAECDKISSKLFKDLENTDYYCPDCKGKFNCKLPASQTYKSNIESIENTQKSIIPEKVLVVCNGMDGFYIPKLHLVMCKCGSCGTRKQTLSEWEKHTGCRAKKWKHSVKVKSTMLPLEKWMAENIPLDGIPEQLDQQQVLAFLQEKYEPVNVKWTTERCAVCRWVEDWEDNKIIICNRCQIAVHQECYGAKKVQDFTSWVCRVCETPDVERECCLCPAVL
ncbi:Histone-lysine N-methyltransferase ATX3 [Glycine max]|nr:Histone-lysine N-methyltransferase ATX3 [Glycine max]